MAKRDGSCGLTIDVVDGSFPFSYRDFVHRLNNSVSVSMAPLYCT